MASKMMTQPRPVRRSSGGQLRPWRTFFIASALYFLLSLREISQWTQIVWFLLAFVAIPIGMAFVLGRGGGVPFGERVRASLWSVGLAMGFYTAINLLRLHAKIGSGSNVFLLVLVVSIVYAIIAGGVCAIAGLIAERFAAAKETR